MSRGSVARDRPSQLSLPPTTLSSDGVYAPTLRHHDGRFWLIVTIVAPGGGTVVLTTEDPAGPWSDPIPVPGVGGIDPDLAWDEAGNSWCTYAGIHQVRIDPQPDLVRLGMEADDGTFDVLAELDGRYLSTEVAGGFTGRVMGLYAVAGTVQFDWFDYEPLEQPVPE